MSNWWDVLVVLGIAFVTYRLTSLLGYFVHWAIHQRWAGPAYRAHMAHHLELYPPGALVTEEYRSAGKRSTVYTFVLAFSPLMLLPVVLCLVGVVGWPHASAALGAMLVVGLLNDVVHDSFHVRWHWLSRFFPRYEFLRTLHFVHHHNMKRNYGIYSTTWDRVFRTFKKP